MSAILSRSLALVAICAAGISLAGCNDDDKDFPDHGAVFVTKQGPFEVYRIVVPGAGDVYVIPNASSTQWYHCGKSTCRRTVTSPDLNRQQAAGRDHSQDDDQRDGDL